jgi:hypothetical protein
MLRRRLLRSSAILASSVSSLLPHGAAKGAEPTELIKKMRESVLVSPTLTPSTFGLGSDDPPWKTRERYPWKKGIITTTFWIGEKPTPRNPTPNHTSSWDPNWAANYGGTDEPDRARRVNYLPPDFVPNQNPFYVALPYNDVTKGQTKPEAAKIIPWFSETFKEAGHTVCKGHWVAIHFKTRTVYAQWEDCGPFRTDHWQYVFGNELPKPNLNGGAGLDVSPAVRDYLGMADTDVTDWRFVDFKDVPSGPWSIHGENNTFVINRRQKTAEAAMITPRR